MAPLKSKTAQPPRRQQVVSVDAMLEHIHNQYQEMLQKLVQENAMLAAAVDQSQQQVEELTSRVLALQGDGFGEPTPPTAQ